VEREHAEREHARQDDVDGGSDERDRQLLTGALGHPLEARDAADR
jgi:hypothetical protein